MNINSFLKKHKAYFAKKNIIIASISLILILLLPIIVVINSRQQNLKTNAAGAATIEAENGTKAGNVNVVSDVNASGGNYVRFGAAALSCTKTLAANGDANTFMMGLKPGDVGCLTSGTTYTTSSGQYDFRNTTSGTASAPITITSTDRANPATIKGRIVFFPGSNYITLTYLKLDGINSGGDPSPTIGSDYITLSYNEITNQHTSICVNQIDDPTYGTGNHTVVDHNRIHDCGVLPSTNLHHGVYLSGLNATVTNNYIYNNADRGVQLRGSRGGIIKNNVIDKNGEGIIFGDLSASNNEVAYNIFTNSQIRWNAESYWGSSAVGTGNTLHHNCFFTTRTGSYSTNGGIDPSITGVTVSNTIVADPKYVDAANANYTLQAGSPCAGYGPIP